MRKFIKSLRHKNQSFTAQDHAYIVRMRKIKRNVCLMLIVGIMSFVQDYLIIYINEVLNIK